LPQGAAILNIGKHETQILEAADHVKLAKVPRQLFNSHIIKAREDAMNKVPHSDTYMQIRDYCQKMEMPTLEQSSLERPTICLLSLSTVLD
jgi:hypothetical protein